jgi:hypothetical protein
VNARAPRDGVTVVDVRIERLVLDGLAIEPHHARRVRAAVELELARLLARTPRAAFAGGAAAHAAAPAISTVPGESPEATGSRIGNALHAAIAGAER